MRCTGACTGFLKSRGAGYRVSGPGVYSNAIEEDYLWAFLKNCAADDCLPDQFTLLCFPYDPIHDKDYFRTICAPDLPYPDALSPDEQYVSHLTDTVQRKLRDAGLRHSQPCSDRMELYHVAA